LSNTRKKNSKSDASPIDTVAQALHRVQRALERAAERAGGRLPDDWSIDVELSAADRGEWHERAAALLEAAREVTLSEKRPPRGPDDALWCCQCKSAECDHATAPGPRYTFDGYAATGKPTWIPFVELCLRRRPPGMDRIFAEPAGVIALKCVGDDLGEHRLAAFEPGPETWEVVGQVVAGLVPQDLDPRGQGDRFALTIQVLRTNFGGQVRFRLGLIGCTRRHVDIQAASGSERSPAEQLRRTLAAARRTLEKLERRSLDEAGQADRISALLSTLRGDLSRIFSGKVHRTKHAQRRHRSGARPTSQAVSDARGASMERVLFDIPRETFVILGRKGRAHVFSRSARHVTSMRLEDGEVTRKKRRQRWREVTPSEYQALRRQLNNAQIQGERSAEAS